MVGNDIIDRNKIQLNSNWQRRGFLQKVCSPEEQEYIRNASDPFTSVWRLWSMKESAYKLYLQQGKAPFFNPSYIHCRIQTQEKGNVCIDKLSLQTYTEISPDYIFTYAVANKWDTVENCIFDLARDTYLFQSKESHQKILQHVAARYRLPIAQLEIRKSAARIPAIYHQGKKLNISFSLTHDGNYAAFSMLNEEHLYL